MSVRIMRWATWMLVFAGMGGCIPTVSEQGRKLCDNALTAYQQGRYADTVKLMDAFLAEHADTTAAGRAYCLRGQARYHLGQTAPAATDLERAVESTEDRDVLANAHTLLGDIAWNGGDMALAQNHYEAALKHCQADASPADHAAYRLGCVRQRLGQWEKADKLFLRVADLFPNSAVAERCAKRTHMRAWTIQVGTYTHGDLARQRAAALKTEGLSADVQPMSQFDYPLFSVQIGRFSTYDEAAAHLARIRRRLPKAIIAVTEVSP